MATSKDSAFDTMQAYSEFAKALKAKPRHDYTTPNIGELFTVWAKGCTEKATVLKSCSKSVRIFGEDMNGTNLHNHMVTSCNRDKKRAIASALKAHNDKYAM